MTVTQTVGVIGVGHLVGQMMPSLIASGATFLLSRRGARVSAELARVHGLEVVGDNQEIVDRSDVVILAVRPWDAISVPSALSFRPEQTLLSLCAGVSREALAAAAAPAELVMAMPVVAARFCESPTIVLGANPAATRLLETCGPVVPLADEAQFMSAAVLATYYGWVHALIAEMADWTSEQGIDPAVSRLLCAQMTRAAATSVRDNTDTSMQTLIDDLATPGSFTGAGLEVLRQADAFKPWREAAALIAGKYRPD